MTIKKMAVVAAMAAMTATAAVPAYAQEDAAPNALQQQYGAAPQGQAAQQEQQQAPQGEEVSVTGVVERLPSDGGPSPYGITDEASGVLYVLDRGEGGFSAYEGQRVTITGTAQDLGAYENLDVSDIRAAQYTGPATDPPQSAEPTVSFELDADCEPPSGTSFYGLAGQEPAELTDPDGDGVYTGSLTLPDGFYDQGAFAMPVWITEGTTEVPNQHTIKAFGKVVLKEGDAFSASVACDGDGATPIGGGTTSGTGVGGGNGGSGGSGGSGAVVSGDTNNGPVVSGYTGNADNDGSGSGGAGDSGSVDGSISAVASGGAAKDGSPSVAQGDAPSAAKALPSSVAKVLPSTGGLALPIAGAVGALLLAGGLLFRRISR